MKHYSKKRVRSALFYTAGLRVVAQISTLASFTLLVRGMSEHEFGVLQLMYAVIPLIGTLASLGIEQTLKRFQPEYLGQGKFYAAAWLMKMAGRIRLFSNVMILGIIFIAWNSIAPFFDLTLYRHEFSLFCLLIIVHFQVHLLQTSLSSHMLQGFSVGAAVILSIAKLIGYAVLISQSSLTLEHAIIVDTVSYALTFAILKFVHYRNCSHNETDAESATMPGTEKRRLMRFGIYNNFSDSGTLLLTSKTDNFFIGAFMNATAVGAYAFYGRLSEMFSHLLPTKQFSNVINPVFFSTSREQAADKVPRYFTLLLNTCFAFQLPILVFVSVYHRELVQLIFDGKFINYSNLLILIASFATLNRVAEPVNLVAQYQEKVSVILFSKIFGLYNAAALILLVPVWGVYGAAFATGSAQIMKNLYVWWKVRSDAVWLNFRSATLMNIGLWVPVVLLCIFLRNHLKASSLEHLLLGIAICGIAVLVHFRGPAFSSGDREMLSALFRGKESRILSWLGLLRSNKSS
jgi:O-antigen/teichoic acid export membrane protein